MRKFERRLHLYLLAAAVLSIGLVAASFAVHLPLRGGLIDDLIETITGCPAPDAPGTHSHVA